MNSGLNETNIIKPQEGYQEQALSSAADIVIGGGAAGAGKTFCLLLDPMRDISHPDFGGVIFRRTTPQITNVGGLQDESLKLYSLASGHYNKTLHSWTFDSGAKIKFSHLEHEKNVFDWQGSQITFIGFDELTHFSKFMFFYMLSRNRSMSGIKPYVRATCNPDPDSWVAELIEWWIGEDGFPIEERCGVLRYFVKDGESMIWGSSKEECLEKAAYFIEPLVEASGADPEDFVKSITFIGGSIYQNKKLLDADPQYLANLAAQDIDERNQLLHGNWHTSINPKDVFDYTAFKDLFTNTFVGCNEKGEVIENNRRITVDVAIGGKDKLIISYFNGRRLEDMVLMDKSSGKEIIDKIKMMQLMHKVQNSRVVYDADGVGAFIGGSVDGFITGAKPFHNNGKPVQTSKEIRTFRNLKAQCYFISGDKVNSGEYYISEKVANMMYNDKSTVRQRFLLERKAIKKATRKNEEPYDLIKKDQMKAKFLSGESPDLLDSFMMNEYFYLKPIRSAPKASNVTR
jgi:hypothetical protein